MKLMSDEKIMSYVLMVKEMEMNPNQSPTKEQATIINQIHQQMEIDQNLKALIHNLISMSNLSDMRNMCASYASGKQVVNIAPTHIEAEKDNVINQEQVKSNNHSFDSGPVISKPKIFTKTIDRKAGYIDALVLSLITGFAGGIITTVVLMMCK